MGKHGICPLSVAPLRQRIVCIPITPPQCGLSPKETRPSCAAADCCYCACCSSPHRSVCCCFCCRSPSLSHRPKHDRPARDDDPPRPASVHCRHTAPARRTRCSCCCQRCSCCCCCCCLTAARALNGSAVLPSRPLTELLPCSTPLSRTYCGASSHFPLYKRTKKVSL